MQETIKASTGVTAPEFGDFMNGRKEIWRAIEGYEGIYEVSDQGRVRNIKRGGRVIADAKVAHGYISVNLYKNNQSMPYLVHRLVAKAFIPNPENKPQVNHKDMVKSHNFVDNLEWVTAQENIEHALKNKPRRTPKNPWIPDQSRQKPNRAADLWRSLLKDIREEKGFTQEQLASACCVSIETIKGLESGSKCFREISLNTACKLAWTLGVNVGSLFEYDVAEAMRREQAWHKKAAERKQKGGVENGY